MAVPPSFIVEASEVLGLSPELIRIAKRNDTLDKPVLHILYQCLLRLRYNKDNDNGRSIQSSPTSYDSCSSRRLLLEICKCMIGAGVWRKIALQEYLTTVSSLSPSMCIGLPAQLANIGIYTSISSNHSNSATQLILKEKNNSIENLNQMCFTYSRIQQKLNKLEQLEKTRAKLLHEIMSDQYIIKSGIKRLDTVLQLSDSLDSNSSTMTFEQKLLILKDAQRALMKSTEHETQFLNWILQSGDDKKIPIMKTPENGFDDQNTALYSNENSAFMEPLREEVKNSTDCIIEAHDIMRRLLCDKSTRDIMVKNLDAILIKAHETLKQENISEEVNWNWSWGNSSRGGNHKADPSYLFIQGMLELSSMSKNTKQEQELEATHRKSQSMLVEIDKLIKEYCPFEYD